MKIRYNIDCVLYHLTGPTTYGGLIRDKTTSKLLYRILMLVLPCVIMRLMSF